MKVPDKRYDPKAIEAKYAEFWRKTKAYERAKKQRAKGKEYYFVDGPPYPSGPVHLGIARNKVLKDAMLRFRRMQGLNVRDQPGFDMHGLPIEVEVEKALGFERKRQIEDGGVDAFVVRCRELAESNQKQMVQAFEDLGIWMDWKNPYLTSSNEYIESAWWTFKKLHTSEHVVREERAVPWCPRCATALSHHEIRYAVVDGDSMYFKLPIRGKRDEYLLVWTTNPWSVIGNMAVAVNPDLNYAKVKVRKGGKVETLFIVEDNVESTANATGIEAYEIMESLLGVELVGLQYFNPLMADVPFLKQVKGEWVHKVVPSSKVTRNSTGLAHVAPGFCAEDYDLSKEHGLPVFSPMDESGILTTEAGLKYAGKTLAEASKQVAADLGSMRFLVHSGTARQRLGACWRCGTPVIQRASKQWFVKATAAREKMMRGIKSISWAPQQGQASVYGFADKTRDWCVSKQRYWGIPLPAWECIADVCGHVEVVGSVKDLRGSAGFRDGMDMHAPSMDKVRMECPKCGGAMKRVPEVLDVWFDSSISTWAQLGYPARRDDFKRWWPCDWVAEAHDQAKGWLYVQVAASSLVFDRMPYKSALIHGWICDQAGKRMSKTGESAVSPAGAIESHGRDALRLYLLGRVPAWEDLRYNPDDLRAPSKFLGSLWSAYRFAASYMNLDQYDLETRYEQVQKALQPEDRWMLSRLETLKIEVTAHMQAQSMHRAIWAIEAFVVHDMSRWYLKLVKGRAWAEGTPDDKQALYWTISESLVTTARLLAPFAPYISEHIYQELDGRLVSIHLADWPAPIRERHDQPLEERMLVARGVVSAANQARQLVGQRLRWPVRKITVEAKEQKVADAVVAFEGAIKSQTNTKALEVVPAGHEWEGLEIQVHPNPNAIGKAYKLWEKKIARMLEIRPAKKIKDDIAKGVYKLGIEGQLIDILPEMVTFTTKLPENIVKSDMKGATVFVDVGIDAEISAEGFSREVIRRVQEMRKDIEMDPEDYAKVTISAGDEVQPLLERWEDAILAETRCSELAFAVDVEEEYVVEWPVDGQNIVIGVTPVRMKAAVDEFMRIPGIEKNLATALVASGYRSPQDVGQAPKDEVLKVPGASHAAIRSINDWVAMSDEMRSQAETSCPVCEKVLAQGAVDCPRCGASLIPGEGPEEEELTSALEESLAESDDSRVVTERASRLLEVIADLRKPARVEESEEVLTELAQSLEGKRAVSGEPAAREPMQVTTAVVEKEAYKAPDEALPAPKREPEPAAEPVEEEEEEEMTLAMAEYVNAVTEGASVSRPVAKSLYMAGYDTLDKLGSAKEDELRKVEKVGKVTARKLVEAFSKKTAVETQMCSLCNAIVPIEAKKCPRCGTPFEWDGGEHETKMIERQMKTSEALDKRLSETPADPNLLYSKAMTVLERGEADEARQLLRAALDTDPSHARAREALDTLSPKSNLIVDSKPPERAPEPEEILRQAAAPQVQVQVTVAQPSAPQATASAESKPAESSTESPQAPQGTVQAFEAVPVQAAEAPRSEEPAQARSAMDIQDSSDRGMELKDGFTYLVREERSQRAYKLMKRYIETGRKGYCVTRNYPDKVREMYGLGDTPVLWLSNVGTKDSVRPKDLEKLSLSLEQFLSKQGGIILLDGLEYLITNNSFITVLRLIQSLRDQVAINRSILVMPVNPDTMSSNELNNLEKEVDVVLS